MWICAGNHTRTPKSEWDWQTLSPPHCNMSCSIEMCFSCSTVTCCCFKTRMGNKCFSRDVIQHEMLIHCLITQRPRRVRWDYVYCHCVWFNLSRYFPGNSILLHLGAGGSRDMAQQQRKANTSLNRDVFTKSLGERIPKTRCVTVLSSSSSVGHS